MDWSKVKVVELASVLAGPAVGTFFAELGAHVVKFENSKTGGDVTRGWKLKTETPTSSGSAYFSAVNHSKKSQFVDLSVPAELEQVKQEIASATFIICNFKPGSASKYGLDFASIQKINPKAIVGNIIGYPNQSKPAFDIVLQAETGFLSMSGINEHNLAKMPVALIDVLAAHQLKEGLLIAFIEQQTDEKAKYVEVSLYEAALASLMNQATNFLMANSVPKPLGTAHPNIAPYGDLMTTKDGVRLVLAIGTEGHFKALSAALNNPDTLVKNANYTSNALRVIHRVSLVKQLQQLFEKLDSKTLLAQLEENKVPFGIVRTMDEVFNSSQAQEGLIETVENGVKAKRYRHNVFKISSNS